MAARALESHLGRKFDAIAPFEMGGSNSMVPMVVAAAMDIPIVNGDGMGRAFPELQMITYLIYDGSPYPAAIADERGSQMVIAEVPDAKWLERIARAATVEMGAHTGLASAVMDGVYCRRSIIPNTLRLASDIGHAVHHAREVKDDPSEAILGVAGGMRYLRGKVTDVHRRNAAGFARGQMTAAGIGETPGAPSASASRMRTSPSTRTTHQRVGEVRRADHYGANRIGRQMVLVEQRPHCGHNPVGDLRSRRCLRPADDLIGRHGDRSGVGPADVYADAQGRRRRQTCGVHCARSRASSTSAGVIGSVSIGAPMASETALATAAATGTTGGSAAPFAP